MIFSIAYIRQLVSRWSQIFKQFAHFAITMLNVIHETYDVKNQMFHFPKSTIPEGFTFLSFKHTLNFDISPLRLKAVKYQDRCKVRIIKYKWQLCRQCRIITFDEKSHLCNKVIKTFIICTVSYLNAKFDFNFSTLMLNLMYNIQNKEINGEVLMDNLCE